MAIVRGAFMKLLAPKLRKIFGLVEQRTGITEVQQGQHSIKRKKLDDWPPPKPKKPKKWWI